MTVSVKYITIQKKEDIFHTVPVCKWQTMTMKSRRGLKMLKSETDCASHWEVSPSCHAAQACACHGTDDLTKPISHLMSEMSTMEDWWCTSVFVGAWVSS